MPAGKRRRTKYRTPRKGTKAREVILLLLRRQGATTKELLLTGTKENTALKDMSVTFIDECGFDIRIIGKRNGNNVWRIVGRYFYGSRKYRSFIGGSYESEG